MLALLEIYHPIQPPHYLVNKLQWHKQVKLFSPNSFNLPFLLFNSKCKLKWKTSFYFSTFIEDVEKWTMKSWVHCIAVCLLLYLEQPALGRKLYEIIIW